jgi:hypothetical protein
VQDIPSIWLGVPLDIPRMREEEIETFLENQPKHSER